MVGYHNTSLSVWTITSATHIIFVFTKGKKPESIYFRWIICAHEIESERESQSCKVLNFQKLVCDKKKGENPEVTTHTFMHSVWSSAPVTPSVQSHSLHNKIMNECEDLQERAKKTQLFPRFYDRIIVLFNGVRNFNSSLRLRLARLLRRTHNAHGVCVFAHNGFSERIYGYYTGIGIHVPNCVRVSVCLQRHFRINEWLGILK